MAVLYGKKGNIAAVVERWCERGPIALLPYCPIALLPYCPIANVAGACACDCDWLTSVPMMFPTWPMPAMGDNTIKKTII